jgi:hypothetical protein
MFWLVIDAAIALGIVLAFLGRNGSVIGRIIVLRVRTFINLARRDGIPAARQAMAQQILFIGAMTLIGWLVVMVLLLATNMWLAIGLTIPILFTLHRTVKCVTARMI